MDRCVVVTITMASAGAVTISVSEEPVNPGGVNMNEYLVWTIDAKNSADWTFMADKKGNSIGIDLSKGNGKNKFKDNGDTNLKQHKWQRKDKGDNDGTTYRYTINVVNQNAYNGPITLTWDPSIMNN